MADKDSKPLERRIQELKVLEHEINCLKKDASVYKQQPNSNIFFKSTLADVEWEMKKNLEQLQEQQKNATVEKTSKT